MNCRVLHCPGHRCGSPHHRRGRAGRWWGYRASSAAGRAAYARRAGRLSLANSSRVNRTARRITTWSGTYALNSPVPHQGVRHGRQCRPGCHHSCRNPRRAGGRSYARSG